MSKDFVTRTTFTVVCDGASRTGIEEYNEAREIARDWADNVYRINVRILETRTTHIHTVEPGDD